MYSSYCNPVHRENTCASTCLYIDTTETKNQDKKYGKKKRKKLEKVITSRLKKLKKEEAGSL